MVDSDEFNNLVLKPLRFFGLWKTENESKFKRILIYIFLFISALPIVFGCIARLIFQFAGYRDSIIELFDVILALVCMMFLYTFLIYYFVKGGDIEKLNVQSRKLIQNHAPDIFNTTGKRYINHMKIIYSFVLLTFFFFITTPLINLKICEENKKHAIYTKDIPCGIPISLWFPFSYDYFPMYHIIFLLTAYNFFLFSFIPFSVLFYLQYLTWVQRLHLDLLKVKINLGLNTQNWELLKKSTIYHIEIIVLNKKTDNLFSIPSLALIFLASTIIGILEYELLIIEHFSESFRLIFPMTAWSVGIFMQSHDAQELTDTSLSIADAVYDANWVDCPIRVRKHILIMLQMAQQPLSISAGPVAKLGHEAYQSLMRNAYSFYAIMANFKK